MPIYLTLAFVLVLYYLTYMDLRERRIPNKIVLPAALFALIASIFFGRWQTSLLGGLVGAAIFTIPIFIYGPDKAGVGDAKLALFLGLWLGLTGVVLAIILGSFFGLGLILYRKVRRTYNPKALVPMAPFLAAGTTLELLLSTLIK